MGAGSEAAAEGDRKEERWDLIIIVYVELSAGQGKYRRRMSSISNGLGMTV